MPSPTAFGRRQTSRSSPDLHQPPPAPPSQQQQGQGNTPFFFPAPHHPHVLDHPTDGTPLHDADSSNNNHTEQQHHPSHHPHPTQLLAAAAAAVNFVSPTSGSSPSSPMTENGGMVSPDGEQQQGQQLPQPIQPGQLPVPFPPPGTVPVAYFAGPGGSIIAIPQLKSKRRQVKNACTNCQKACKKCDEVRPCTRCVKYGIDKECIDSQRKERKKGIKRGPYKKREPKTAEDEEAHAASLAAAQLLTPENAAALQAMAGAVIYSYGHHQQQHMQHPQSPSQAIKGPDGNYVYPSQYYITPGGGGPSGEPQEEGVEEGEGSSSTGASGSGVASGSGQQQQGYSPVQYYSHHQQAAAGGYAQGYAQNTPGFIVQSSGTGGQANNPVYQLSPATMAAVGSHHNDDPIERQQQKQQTPPSTQHLPISKGKGKGESKAERRARAAAAANETNLNSD